MYGQPLRESLRGLGDGWRRIEKVRNGEAYELMVIFSGPVTLSSPDGKWAPE